jgi:hypothetical protein
VSSAVGSAVYRAICRHAEILTPGWPKRCDLTGKVIYATSEAAEAALAELNLLSNQGDQYSYRCKPSGHYHLTRRPQNRIVWDARRGHAAALLGAYPNEFQPRHADLARAILDNLDGDRAMRCAINSTLRWGVSSSQRGRGQIRIKNALLAFERRGWIRRDGLAVVVMNRTALFTLVEWFAEADDVSDSGVSEMNER